MINWSLPIGGFGLNETTAAIFCRHVLFCPSDAVDSQIVVEAGNNIAYLVDTYSDLLETVASGHKTLAQAIDELVAEE